MIARQDTYSDLPGLLLAGLVVGLVLGCWLGIWAVCGCVVVAALGS